VHVDRGQELAALHRKLKRIAKARGLLDVQEAEALREAQRLQLWRHLGYASLADYMTTELGYSFRSAEDRLRVANALPQLPKLTEALQTGNLNFSQARELARVVTPETEQVWIDKAADLNVRQVEQAVAGHSKGDLPEDPVDPRLVRRTMWLSVRPETEVLFRDARRALEKQRGEKLDEDAVLEALCRAFLRGDQRDERNQHDDHGERDDFTHVGDGSTHVGASSEPGASPETTGHACASGGAPYRVAVTVCKACKRGWQHGGGLVEEMTPPAVETAMCDAQWIGDLDSNVVERARQEISAAMRRKVLHRDQGRCQVPGCRAHRNLDVHHILHLEHGGTNELSNLTTLCEAHHLAHHAGTLVIERVGNELKFRREGRNRFTRATREVETRKVLRERGLDREVIKQIMTRTVTHVGESDLSAEQWLAIALRYAERIAM
jgi:hypothetical protein